MNLSWVTPHLAIGGRVLEQELPELVGAGVGAVIDLRSEAVDEAAVLRARDIAFLHLPTDDHAAITPAMLESGVEFAETHIRRGRRVLVHCEHGIGRSATLALCILVAGGCSPLQALRLAKGRRERVSPSPAQYQCWKIWLESRRAAQTAAWDVPDFDAFAAIAYRHLSASRG